MRSDFNKVILIGCLYNSPKQVGHDPERLAADFSLSLTRNYEDRDNNLQHETVIVPCRLCGPQIARLLEFYHKGSGIVVEGILQRAKWKDDDGLPHSRLYVAVQYFRSPNLRWSSRDDKESPDSQSEETVDPQPIST